MATKILQIKFKSYNLHMQNCYSHKKYNPILIAHVCPIFSYCDMKLSSIKVMVKYCTTKFPNNAKVL